MTVSEKRRGSVGWWVCFIICLASKALSTPFYNLDFEHVIQPLIPSDEYNRVPITHALPGWRGLVGAEPATLVLTNDYFVDSAGLSLFGPGGPDVISGNYTAFLQSGFPLYQDPIQPVSASLAQTGQVPADAQSILLKARVLGGPLSVSLGDQTLTLVPLAAGANYTLYGANIPGMAGQTEELRITAVDQPGPPWRLASWVWLDSISFSPDLVVPEPGTVGLLLTGGCLFRVVWAARRSRRANRGSPGVAAARKSAVIPGTEPAPPF